MIYEIKNKKLTVKVNSLGAELFSVISNKTNYEYIWQGDEKYWTSRCPNLFPFTGRLFESSYLYEGKKYEIGNHGFARHCEFKLFKQTANELIFLLTDSKEINKVYPFKFNYFVSYKLISNTLVYGVKIINTDTKQIIFSYGFHPGFNITKDSYLDLNTNKVSLSDLSENGLDLNAVSLFKLKSRFITFDDAPFDKMNFFIKISKGNAKLIDKVNNHYVKVSFNGMTNLGLWRMPNAPYICIEPWHGLPGRERLLENLEDKLYTIKLGINEKFANNIKIKFGK